MTLKEALQKILPTECIILEPGCDHASAMRMESAFSECSIDGLTGFRATYWNGFNPVGEPVTVTHVGEPFHFTNAGPRSLHRV